MNSALLRTVLALLACLAFLPVAAACGPSPGRKATLEYRGKVEPRIQREQVVWGRIAELKDELDDDWNGPRYYPYLEGTAAPFYRDAAGFLAGLEPVDARVADAHRELRAFLAARLRFVELELQRRERMKRSGKHLQGLRTKQFAADQAVGAYREAVGPDGAFDGRLNETISLSERCYEELVRPCVDGRADPDAVVDTLRKRYLPAFQDLRSGRFPNDDASALLRELIILHDEAFQLMASDVPGPGGQTTVLVLELIEMQKAVLASSAAAAEAERAREAFRKAFAAAGRD